MIALSLLLAAPALAVVAPAPTNHAATTFARLTTLAGTWRNAGNPASPLRIHFYTTAGGTVLVEDWRRGTAAHSLTLYHRDGASLIATHYCPQGNQPRLVLQSGGTRFAFRDATDLDPATESHQHGLSFDLTDPARPVRSETYRAPDGTDEPSRMVLMRVSDAPLAGAGAI